jgi:hypothetical protein
MRRTLKLSLALTPTRKTEVTTLTPKKMTKTENLIIVIMMLEPPKVRMTMMTTMMMRMITRMMKGMTKMITEMTRKMQATTTQLQAATTQLQATMATKAVTTLTTPPIDYVNP